LINPVLINPVLINPEFPLIKKLFLKQTLKPIDEPTP